MITHFLYKKFKPGAGHQFLKVLCYFGATSFLFSKD